MPKDQKELAKALSRAVVNAKYYAMELGQLELSTVNEQANLDVFKDWSTKLSLLYEEILDFFQED